MSGPYFVSRAYDFGWFVLPGIVTAILALAWGLASGVDHVESSGIGVWIAGVLLVDVAHVYASLYRTYLDAGQRQRHFKLLIWAPLLCATLGFALHARSPRYFWAVLAYVAIFHFIKQHIGFAMLYVRAGRESTFDRRLTEVAIWTGTLVPIIYWHAHLPRQFVWFKQGDLFAGLPTIVATVFLIMEVPVLLFFIARRIQLTLRGNANAMVVWLALIPALNWHLGIVLFNSDRIFTITNVIMHGVPYMALVWLTGGQQTMARAVNQPENKVPQIILAALFYGFLLTLAFAEEAAWNRLVWNDFPQLFGAGEPLVGTDSLLGALVVALLVVPQATHYLLDRWIWRVGPDNPELATQLNLARFRADSAATVRTADARNAEI